MHTYQNSKGSQDAETFQRMLRIWTMRNILGNLEATPFDVRRRHLTQFTAPLRPPTVWVLQPKAFLSFYFEK